MLAFEFAFVLALELGEFNEPGVVEPAEPEVVDDGVVVVDCDEEEAGLVVDGDCRSVEDGVEAEPEPGLLLWAKAPTAKRVRPLTTVANVRVWFMGWMFFGLEFIERVHLSPGGPSVPPGPVPRMSSETRRRDSSDARVIRSGRLQP